MLQRSARHTMGNHINAYFCSSSDESAKGNFHRVIALHDAPQLTWKEVKRLVPRIPKGWFELCHLAPQDRIEFLREYWLSSLPFCPSLSDFLVRFFGSLDEIGLYITQRTFDDPCEARLVYGLKEDGGFFQGGPPAQEADLVALQRQFPDVVLPVDYLAFLKIHDGFAKFTDTGVTISSQMQRQYRMLQNLLEQKDEPLLSATKEVVDPKSLIPFYESFGFPCFQCFWSDWYPEQEMGNVYYSGLTHTITDHTSGLASPENQTFPSFLDWLMFYLETIEI